MLRDYIKIADELYNGDYKNSSRASMHKCLNYKPI